MKKMIGKYAWWQRIGALALAALLVFGVLPTQTIAATNTDNGVVLNITTDADPDTIRRPVDIYGKNTLNAGKVTVGKSVSDTTVKLENNYSFTPSDGNFLVTVSQAAQVVGLATEQTVPVDVVFVLDTSGSMSGGKDQKMVVAANSAIKTLLEANPYNRVAVVGFSGVSGTANTDKSAASLLSELKHYDDEGNNKAASEHLTYSSSARTITGRRMINNARAARSSQSSGTNFHAGVYLGAQQLMNATDIQVNVGGTMVTRMPFLVLLSDGEPSYAADDINDNGKWYEPSLTSQLGNRNPTDGQGFLAALTAAYYKGAITEKYFGTNASANNRCFIYTMGLALTGISNPELAQMMLDPTGRDTGNDYYDEFEAYWRSYEAGRDYNVKISTSSRNNTFEITADSIKASSNFVNGKLSNGTAIGYNGGYKYNDKYYPADDVDKLTEAFDDMVVSIQLQSMASPTRVDATYGKDFSGYVTFHDPIGEYMEVKSIKGLLSNGTLYQGNIAARYLQNWDTEATTEFKNSFIKVLQERCKVTGSSMDAEAFIEAARNSKNQAYYTSDSDYDNSLVWWGQSYTPAGEEDPQVKWLQFADDDSVEFIEKQKAAGSIPAGADYVCRSYYFYGTQSGNNDANADYLHFVIRVQRSLTAPYQETVVVSAPSSLLSVEKVLVTENTDANGNKTYTAAVTPADPARVVYEVGLRSDINAFNVAQIVGNDAGYVQESVTENGQNRLTNYNVDTNGQISYSFYTNDWDREATEDSHHRAMAKATFEAAADNSFYTYTKDTLLYVKNGENYVPYTGARPSGDKFYYARTYYDWKDKTETNGEYPAEAKVAYIEVDLPSNARLTQKDGNWYINQGVYTASELIRGEGDQEKDPDRGGNITGTAKYVNHPHRTEGDNNSHYTVLLGNNGKLTLKSQKSKDVALASAPEVSIDGKSVMIGDELLYKIDVINPEKSATYADITDLLPDGTEYVADSASHDGVYDAAKKQIKWTKVEVPAATSDAHGKITVTFKVKVTVDALIAENQATNTVENYAVVELENEFAYTTNTTKNPVEGKYVVDSDYNVLTSESQVQVPQVLEFRIAWYNNSNETATINITDKLPTGTTFVDASHGGALDANGNVVWQLTNVAPGASGTVSLFANVNPNAGATIENEADINDRDTNITVVGVKKGDLVLSKTVKAPENSPALAKEFTFRIVEVKNVLDATLKLYKLNDQNEYVPADNDITFIDGVAELTIKNGEQFKIEGIPAGSIFSVTETAISGFTPAYFVNGATEATSSQEGRVTITENTAAQVKVENTYAPIPASFTITAEKVLEAAADVASTRFGFVAYACDEDGEPLTGDAAQMLTGEATVSSETDKNRAHISFSPVTFDKADVYYYLVDEIDGGLAGVNYDPAQFLLTITVTDDGSGTLQYAVTMQERQGDTGTFADANAVVFTNSYAPEETSLTLKGTKIMEGRTLETGRYAFEVKDSSGKVVTTGSNLVDGSNKHQGAIQFKPITFTKTGTYTYTVTEVNSNITGVTYSDAVYTVVISVTDNNGRLDANVVKVNDTAVSNNQYDLRFTNRFKPDDVTVTLSGTKTLTGGTLSDQQFAFQVTDASGKIVAAGNNTDLDNDGLYDEIQFTPIVFTKDMLGNDTQKELTFTVKELIPDALGKDPNMHYDASEFTVKVDLSYDNETGKLTAGTPRITKNNETATIAFINVLRPSSVDVTIEAKKFTNGANPPDNLSFSFTVEEVAKEAGKDGTIVSGGRAPANGEIQFNNLTYTKPGDYYYWIYESNHAGTTEHGVSFDGRRLLLEVKVTRDETTRVWSTVTNYYDAGTVNDPKVYTNYIGEGKTALTLDERLFTNTYAAQGALQINAFKALTGNRALKAGDFQFVLERLDENGQVISTLNATNAANGTIQFPSVIYTNADLDKEFHYRMRELRIDSNLIPGVTYDTTTHYLKVTLTAQDEKIIPAVVYCTDATFTTPTENQAERTFRNSYAAVEGTSVTMTAKKVLNGRDLKAGEFLFQLYHNGAVVDTATNDANGNVSFTRHYSAGALNNLSEVETTYTIKEVDNNLGGITYSTAEVQYKVVISDGGDGKLNAEATLLSADRNFNNTYKAAGTTFAPTAKKQLNNRTLKANEFSFEIKNSAGTTVATGRNAADGTIQFSQIGYETTGSTTYTVVEVQGGLPGMAYDKTVKYLKVTVTDDGKGGLHATGKFYSDADCTTELTEAVFTNTYMPENISVQFAATKTLTGRRMEAGEFSFVALDAAGNPVATGSNAQAGAGQSAAVNFSNIGYSLTDLEDVAADNGIKTRTFRYRIMEKNTAQGGVTFDTTVYYAEVTLTYNEQTGELNATTAYYTNASYTEAATAVQFTNSYAPVSVKLDLPVDKILINKALVADEFIFTLSDMSGKQLQTETNASTGVVAFEPLKFETIGVYKFVISEAVNSTDEEVKARYTLDAPITVIVNVTDDLKGNLVANAQYYKNYVEGGQNVSQNGAEFINYYTAPAIQVPLTTQIKATKTVKAPENTTYSPAGFRFKVTDITGNPVKTKDAEGNLVDLIGVSGADGQIVFPDFHFDKAAEYHYWISEIAPDPAKGGIQIDSRVWEVRITVRYNENTTGITDYAGENVPVGQLYIGVGDVKTYQLNDGAATNAGDPVFENIYTPKSAELTIQAVKKLEGRDLLDQEFLFELVEDGIVVGTARNDASGNVSFYMTYQKAGNHSYNIREVAGDKGGVTYSDDVATVTVNVTDDLNGQLSASATYADGQPHVFMNIYTAQPVTVEVPVGKTIIGDKTFLSGEVFNFELTDNADPTKVYTATNGPDGMGTFSVPLSAAGTYTYTMREIAGDDTDHFNYDTNTYTVTIEVTDDGVGKLHGHATYGTADGLYPVFQNEYIADPVLLTLEGTKKLTGRDMEEGEFNFLVHDSNGTQVATGTNAADGTITFTQISLPVVGDYIFTVTEVAGEAQYVTYDTTAFTVNVTVTNTDGVLSEEVSYPADGVVFENTYKVPETTKPSQPTEPTKPGASPDTGDHSNFLGYSTLAVVSLGLAMFVVLMPKRRKTNG